MKHAIQVNLLFLSVYLSPTLTPVNSGSVFGAAAYKHGYMVF